ncbi:MAG: M1 family metallopeptidase [Ferruginibacter sp.]
MKKLPIIVIVLFCNQLSSVYGQADYWQQQVDVKIDVTLNDKEHALDGFIRMDYHNNSPDTLYYLWFHLWPNAYKHDRTAFSDQLLENGRTEFYFSNNDKRGYINRLDFKVGGVVAMTEDHPQHQDITRLILPQPLPPKSTTSIQTPFHVQLPFNFSRGGHIGQSYQVTQWFPKPAVYDRKGWHPMPYLHQGEFYGEFGNYEVQITLPENYVVAATGDLQDQEEQVWLKKKIRKPADCYDCRGKKKQRIAGSETVSSGKTKTIHFKQEDIHDFAWFADKDFIIYYDSLQLPGGKKINLYSYHLPKTTNEDYWARSTQFIKNTILTRSNWLGSYPYNTVSVVEAVMGLPGGMEYPTITSIYPVDSESSLERVIGHEVGHNWNYGILGSNEREHPWMDEGIDTYYDNRYRKSENFTPTENPHGPAFFAKRIPQDLSPLGFNIMASNKRDQPAETASENFSEINYGLSAYYKTGEWVKLIENKLGTALFDSCMHAYYRRWKFKHPYPEDFIKVLQDVSGENMDEIACFLKGAPASCPRKKRF